MKKFSITLISLVAMTGLATAQQKGAGAGSAAAGAGVGVSAGAKAGAGTGAGSAAAGAATGAKAGAGAATGAATGTAAGAKAGAGAATGTAQGAAGATATTTAKVELPKPPAEIAATVKLMGARKACTGTGMGPDMQMADMKGTVTSKVDMGGWWIRQDINETIGKGKTASKLQITSYMTWDAKLGKWRVIGVSNDGGSMTGTADMKDGKYEFTGEMTTPMGVMAFKDHGDMTDKKAVKFWGEMSMDKGKTWTKVYDQTCK